MCSAIDQPTRRREKQSVTVARYRNSASPTGKYVMSPTYLLFGALAVKSRRSRSGTGVAEGSGTVVMEDGQVRRPVTGAPQGGVILPLLCNVYLHRLDRAWDVHDGSLVRYADDLVVMCFSRSQAERALFRLVELLGEVGLKPEASKTRIVHLEVGGEGFDFLGFHHRQVPSRGLHGRRRVDFLARWPSNRAMQHARDRIREITARRRLLLHPQVIVGELNLFLRGWMAYFRYGHSARRFGKIGRYARERVAHFISRKHRRSRAFGRWVLPVSSPRDLGLVSPYGTVVAPRAGKPWRERPNAAGERRR